MATVPDELENFYRFATQWRSTHPEFFSIERAYYAWLNEKWEPQTPLGKVVKQHRGEFIASGGKLLTIEEIDAEVADRRGTMAH